MKTIKRLYNWVLHWADTRYGGWALFGLAFAESSFFPIPPDVLLIALAIGQPRRAFKFAAICTLGSVLGGLFGYLIGAVFWGLTKEFFFSYVFSVNVFEKVHHLYSQNAFMALFTAAFTPIPYKVFTIAAGVFGISIPVFLIASMIGRAMRFFLVALFIFKFGAPVKNLIDKYFELFTIVFTILLIGGFILIKFIASH